MIPITVNPLADQRFRQTRWGNQAEMRVVEAEEILAAPTPTDCVGLSNRASALYLSNMTNEALVVARAALEQGRGVMSLVNMAVVLEALGRFEEALPYAREATTVDPEDNRASAMYGEMLLRLGHFAEGWPLYAKERASHGWMSLYGVPEWEGQPLAGKRLLVIEGGGYGDNIYFLRWLGVLRRRGARIDYICQPSFAPLVRRLGYRAIENWAGNVDLDYRSYDYFTSILALGYKLGVTLENYRWEGPYIPGRRWWKRSRRNPRVGLCWRAGEGRSPRKSRSLSDEQLRRITHSLGGLRRWVNLSFNASTPVEMIWPKISNWYDTTRALATLDLLVTVDTAVAHLGGAMGVPTWVILPGASAWQYPVGHATHPLYPSMQCFWNGGEGMNYAVENVGRALEDL